MRQKRDREATVAKLKEAASGLIARFGYEYTTLDRIAEEAGFTKGTVFYYFKSKENLMLELLDDIQGRSLNSAETAIAAAGDSARAQMNVFMTLMARWAAKHSDDLALLMRESINEAPDDAPVHSRVVAFYDKMAQMLERIIERGKRSGEFSSDLVTRKAVLSIIAIHDGNMLAWYRSGRKPAFGRMLHAAAQHEANRALGLEGDKSGQVESRKRKAGTAARSRYPVASRR